MAIHDESTDTTQAGTTPNFDTTANARTTSQASGDNVTNKPMVGFGVNPIFTMAANTGSEYTNKIANGLIEVYKSLPETERPKVNILDKEVITGLAYSTIVISLKANDIVNYYLVMLESTGREPMTAADIMAEVNSKLMATNQVPFIYTPDDAIDEVLHDKAREALHAEYNLTKFSSVDGLVVPDVQHDDTQMIIRIASIGFNACRSEKALIEGQADDLNIRVAKAQSPNMILKIESNLLKQTTKDEVDKPIRADWQIELSAIDTTNNVTSLNLQNAKITLVKSAGFIDAIPTAINVPTTPGMPPVQQIRLHPHVIIDSDAVFATTPGYALLGLISSLVMTNNDMWVAALMPSDSKKGVRNIGALNLITNLENAQNGVGSILNLTDKNLTRDEVYATIKQMFSLDPVVSFDIESFGPQTHYTSMFSIAAEPQNSRSKQNAARQIVKAAHHLTDGNFPKDFPLDQIFVSSGVTVPMGKWADKTGERDIRDIDAAFIATQTSDVDLINKWALSGLPKEKTGMDPYITKVDIISKLIPDARITGKCTRVTFTAFFIQTLIDAAMRAGLDARYEPAITFAETSNLSILDNYLAGAGVNNVAGFARTATAQGPSWTTPYSHAGYGRY